MWPKATVQKAENICVPVIFLLKEVNISPFNLKRFIINDFNIEKEKIKIKIEEQHFLNSFLWLRSLLLIYYFSCMANNLNLNLTTSLLNVTDREKNVLNNKIGSYY